MLSSHHAEDVFWLQCEWRIEHLLHHEILVGRCCYGFYLSVYQHDDAVARRVCFNDGFVSVFLHETKPGMGHQFHDVLMFHSQEEGEFQQFVI